MEGLKKMASEETYNDTISEKVITKKELKKNNVPFVSATIFI